MTHLQPPGTSTLAAGDRPQALRILRRARTRGAFTLLEMSISLGIVALLMGSLGSVVVLASRALPTPSAVASSSMGASDAADQLGQDLRFATRMLTTDADRLAFTIPDRTGNGVDETLVYEWGGSGRPLLRTFNADDPVVLVESLHDFNLQYARRRYATSEFIHTTTDSGEVLLCTFTGWSGVTHSVASFQVTGTSYASEKFVVDRIAFPSDTISWQITRVSLRLRSDSSLGSGVTVGIHRPASLLGIIPLLTPVGTPGIIPSSAMTTSVQWLDATFNDVEFTDINESHFCIVVQPAIATNAARISYYTATNPPKDNYVFQTSSDAGLTWGPTNNTHRNDAPFYVYGSYRRSGIQEVITETFTLGHVTVALQPSAESRSRLITGVHLANHPETPAP